MEWISKENRLKEIILDCPIVSIRKSSLNLISTCLKLLSKFELANFQLDYNENVQNDRSLPVIQIILDKLISLWPVLVENVNTSDQYFDLLNQIAQLGIPRYYLLYRNIPRQILILISEIQNTPQKKVIFILFTY